jgi:hypothetical protein
MDTQQISVVLPQYMRLCESSTETIRRNPLTSQYSERYFRIAAQHGLVHARRWLLGSLINDFHSFTSNQ